MKKNYYTASAYRPISLTSCLGKSLERIITTRLYGFIEHNKIIDEDQEGFRKFHGTCHALLRLTQDIYDGFNSKNKTLVAFVDMAKAFDSVWREGLLVKINRLGVAGLMWNWIEDLLKKRTARCFLKGQNGDSFSTEVGLPQGSVISPVLFNLYIEDIYNEVNSNKVKFADDGTIWTTGADLEVLEKETEKDLGSVLSWSKRWRMNLNIDKTEICLFTKHDSKALNNKQPVVKLDNKNIQYNPNPRILGLHMDEQLNFQHHL